MTVVSLIMFVFHRHVGHETEMEEREGLRKGRKAEEREEGGRDSG